MWIPVRRICAATLLVCFSGGCAREEPWQVETPTPLPNLPMVDGQMPNTVALPWALEGSKPAGRQLVIAVSGADCRTPQGVQVTSTADTVTLTVWGTEASACPSARSERTVVFGAQLPEPLNGRPLGQGK